MHIIDTLKARGFINQLTDEKATRDNLEKGSVTFYAGYDGTARSLHIGNLVTIMGLRHLQKAGHKPIVLVGGGTTRIGDPSGKNATRQMLNEVDIDQNAECIKKQLSKYLDFSDKQALLVNNAEWLLKLNYIQFLRDVGSQFSVNRMIASETYKARLDKEESLSFIEFNYQILQAYDFYVLNRDHKCTLQVGGSDQWGNIVAGIDLTRRLGGEQLYGITFPLVTNADGSKMGKSVNGAIWLDEENLKPFDYYQYWINIDDRDVKKFLLLFTELPISEVEELANLEGADIRIAKQKLAYEATLITHGLEKTQDAVKQSEVFSGSSDNAPELIIEASQAVEGKFNIIELLMISGFHSSKSEARRVIQQGGVKINEDKISDLNFALSLQDIKSGSPILQSGKKKKIKLISK